MEHAKDTASKVEELEEEIARLREENESLRKELGGCGGVDGYNEDLKEVMVGYEATMERLLAEQEEAKRERDFAKVYLTNLEGAFFELVRKFERAKAVIKGFQENERSYMKNVKSYQEIIGKTERSYLEFRDYAINKLNDANKQLELNNKLYGRQLKKLREKAVQNQLKVNDLERKLAGRKGGEGDESNLNLSIFDPLKTNIIY